MNLAALYYLRTGEEKFLAPFHAAVEYGLEYLAAGRPALGPSPAAGQERIWSGGKLTSAAMGALSSLAAASGIKDPSWRAYQDAFATSYNRYGLDPTREGSLQDVLLPVADTPAESWPYRTTEGVMTDRIAVPGIGDVISYYMGADVYSVYFGLPLPAVTWSGTGRLFAAAVGEASRNSLRATLYLFEDEGRRVGLRFWGLDTEGEYVLDAGPAPCLGRDPEAVAESVPFRMRHRGQQVQFNLPGRTVYAVRVRALSPGVPVPPPAPNLTDRRDRLPSLRYSLATTRAASPPESRAPMKRVRSENTNRTSVRWLAGAPFLGSLWMKSLTGTTEARTGSSRRPSRRGSWSLEMAETARPSGTYGAEARAQMQVV